MQELLSGSKCLSIKTIASLEESDQGVSFDVIDKLKIKPGYWVSSGTIRYVNRV